MLKLILQFDIIIAFDKTNFLLNNFNLFNRVYFKKTQCIEGANFHVCGSQIFKVDFCRPDANGIIARIWPGSLPTH